MERPISGRGHYRIYERGTTATTFTPDELHVRGGMKEFRFAVGGAAAKRSSSWKLWTQGDEAYLLQHGPTAKHQKFSFHRSGNCRWAEINARRSGAERVILEWARDPVPREGGGQGSLLLSIFFPTNHLSDPQAAADKRVRWIEPAPDGKALQLTLIVTKEPKDTIQKAFVGGASKLLCCLPLRSGMHLCASAIHADCGPVEIRVPGEPKKPSQVFGELFFPNEDTSNSGRPIRMVLIQHKGAPPSVWELGGYRVTPDVG